MHLHAIVIKIVVDMHNSVLTIGIEGVTSPGYVHTTRLIMFTVCNLDTGDILSFATREEFDIFLWDICNDGYGVGERKRAAWFSW